MIYAALGPYPVAMSQDVFLQSSPIIDWNHLSIAAQADQLRQGLTDRLDIIRACFHFVRDEIRHSVDYQCGPVTCTHAVAVHRRAFDRILADIPSGGEEFDQWLSEWLACDQYLFRRIADGTFRAVITSPRLATQPPLLYYDNADRELARRYVI